MISFSAGTPKRRKRMSPLTAVDIEPFAANGDLLVVTGLREIIYRVQPDGQMDIFLEDDEGEKLIAPANCAFGGPGLTELYITNLLGYTVSRVRG
jgi:sugar lactone lactonase YvrE